MLKFKKLIISLPGRCPIHNLSDNNNMKSAIATPMKPNGGLVSRVFSSGTKNQTPQTPVKPCRLFDDFVPQDAPDAPKKPENGTRSTPMTPIAGNNTTIPAGRSACRKMSEKNMFK